MGGAFLHRHIDIAHGGQRGAQFCKGQRVFDRGPLPARADRALGDGEDQHQHGGQQINRDGPGPRGHEIARIEDHRIGAGDRRIGRVGSGRHGLHILRRALQCRCTLGQHLQNRSDRRPLRAALLFVAAVKLRQHDGGRQILRRAFHQRGHGKLPQPGDQTCKPHGLFGKLDRARLNWAGLYRKGAHAAEDLVPFCKGVIHQRGLGGDLRLQRAQFCRLLPQHPEHRAASGKTRQAASGLLLAQVFKALSDPRHVPLKPLSRQGNLMGALQRALVVLHRLGQMLFHRRRSGERGGVQPARHRDDRDGAEAHRPQKPHPRTGRAHSGEEPQQIGPEDKDAHRDRHRIGDRGKGRHGAIVVQQRRHAKVGVNARGHGQNAKRRAGECIEPCQVALQFTGVTHPARLRLTHRFALCHGPPSLCWGEDRGSRGNYQTFRCCPLWMFIKCSYLSP